MVSFGVDLKMFERSLLLMFSRGINLQLFILRDSYKPVPCPRSLP